MSLLKRIAYWLVPPIDEPGPASKRPGWRQEDVLVQGRTVDEYVQATARWRERNEQERARGCQCGKTNTRVKYHGGNIGSVPVEFWSCDEHFGVTRWGCRPTDLHTPNWTPCETLTDAELRAAGYWW